MKSRIGVGQDDADDVDVGSENVIIQGKDRLFLLNFYPSDYARLDRRCMAVHGMRPAAWLETLFPGPGARIDPVKLEPNYDRNDRSFRFYLFIHPDASWRESYKGWAYDLVSSIDQMMRGGEPTSRWRPTYQPPETLPRTARTFTERWIFWWR